ncbi:MAG TPA: substrate-binding domain-containing protein [Armatimonadota bacterium]|nr:substrate-binding domain-containing protein [Armatimonadota bacterium]
MLSVNRRALLAMLLAAPTLLAGCGGAPPAATPSAGGGSAPAPGSKGTIGLSVLTLTNPFFKVIADSMTEEARKHGYEVAVVSGEFDVAKQQNQVKDFIVRKVAAIVLTPCDSKAIGPAIQEANAAGIPVFTADIACLAPGAKVVTHIATDNYGGGKEAAKAMIEALGENGGKIAVLDFPVVESCILRVKGFKEVIAQHNAGRGSGKIQIVSTLNGGGLKDQGYKAAEDILQAHPDLAGIFAINDPSALGARAALEKAGKADQVKIIAFDGQPEGKQAIRDGKIYADPIQFPEKIGARTVQTIVQHFAGEETPKEVLIPTALYRQADGRNDPSLK